MSSNSKLLTSFRDTRRSAFCPEIPLANTTISIPKDEYMNCKYGEFTGNYRQRLSTAWSPYIPNRPDPPLLVQNSEIYHRHVGHIPNYTGYIPGAIFRCGTTYGSDTKDGKRWIRGDFS